MKEDLELGLEESCQSASTDRRIIPEIVLEAVDFPWKGLPNGIQQLGRWMHLGESNTTFRRFDYLGTRYLLYKMAKLQKLEVELNGRDTAWHKDNPNKRYVIEEDIDENEQFFERCSREWKSYMELLVLKARADKLPKAAHRNMENLDRFMKNHTPFEAGHGLFFNSVDMALLGTTRENTWMDGLIEGMAHGLPYPIKRTIFHAEAEDLETGDSDLDPDRVNMFTKAILIMLVGLLLSAPLYPLFSWTQGERVDGQHMAMIMALQTGCTAIFGAVLHMCTTAKRHEIFTASVAYMAILVVFMGQVRQS